MLPLDRLCVGSLENLLYQESFIALDDFENIIFLGGHQVGVLNTISESNELKSISSTGGQAVETGDRGVS